MTDPATQRRIAECGKALAIACARAMTVGGSVNLPTMLTGCARMSGSYLLRSFNLDLSAVPAGQAVLSAEAGDKTSMLLRFCASILQTLGTTIGNSPTASLEEQRSRLKQDFLETQRTLEPEFAPLMRQYALDDEQMAKAAALATGALIHQCAKHLDPNIGFGYAAYGFAEGARTAPIGLSSGSNPA
jgi:hypothetical protein